MPTLTVTKVLAFGDSLTEGQTALDKDLALTFVTSYPTYLQRSLTERYSKQAFSVVNAGKSGEWAQDGKTRLPSVLDRNAPEVLLLMEGVNDMNTQGRSGMRRALDAMEVMVQNARAKRIRVLVGTLPPQRPGAPKATSAALVPEFNAELRKIAADEGALLVDVSAAFGTNYGLLSEDGLHPTPLGYELIAQTFFAALRGAFEASASQLTHSY